MKKVIYVHTMHYKPYEVVKIELNGNEDVIEEILRRLEEVRVLIDKEE